MTPFKIAIIHWVFMRNTKALCIPMNFWYFDNSNTSSCVVLNHFLSIFLSWKWLIMSTAHILLLWKQTLWCAGLRSAVGNMSGYRCVSDCRSRGREFIHGLVPYFHGDWSWNNFYGHSPPFHGFIQEGLLLVTSKSMYTNYSLTACSSLPRKKYG